MDILLLIRLYSVSNNNNVIINCAFRDCWSCPDKVISETVVGHISDLFKEFVEKNRREYDPKYLIHLDTHHPGNFDATNKKETGSCSDSV